MTIAAVVAAVLFAAFAVSYGWGVRGYIIGGEKGALLPGALLGFSISLFCCNGELKEFFPYFCAAGALSMFYGGTEPYAQTMSYILKRDDVNSFAYDNVPKGITGIFLKGALWFGISGIILGILPGALSGVYSKNEIVIMFVSIPLLSFIGRKIFNSPFNSDKKIFPVLYFSNGSREEWGGNVLILLEMGIFAGLHKDFFALGGALFGLISGGIGFVLGLSVYDFCVRKHNGKYFFGKLQENGYIDGWKIMEHTLGALGGGGVMLWFCINSGHLSDICSENLYAELVSENNPKTDLLFSIAVTVMLLITSIQYFIVNGCRKNGKKEPDVFIFEIIERPLFSAFPLIFVFSGFYKTALTVSFVTLIYALCEKCVFEWFEEQKNAKIVSSVFSVIFVISVSVFYIFNSVISSTVLITVYTFGYLLPILYKSYNGYRRNNRKSKKLKINEYYKGRLTVDMHFVIQCIVICAVSFAKIYC